VFAEALSSIATPLEKFPDIWLASPSELPPMTFSDASRKMDSPLWRLPMTFKPVWSVPTRLPMTTLFSEPGPDIETPLKKLPDRTLPLTSVPPMTLFCDSDAMDMP
jgi:hypothetical protein